MQITVARRFVAALMVCLLAAGCTFALAACSNDEKVIRDGITKVLDPFKNPTKENMASALGEMDDAQLATLEAYGVDIYEFLGHVFRGFDYTVGDIQVNGDKATAAVSVTTIDLKDATDTAMQKVESDSATAAKVQELAEAGNQAEIMKYVFELMYEAMDAEQKTVTTDVTLTLTKTNNEWNVDESSMGELISAMYGGLSL